MSNHSQEYKISYLKLFIFTIALLFFSIYTIQKNDQPRNYFTHRHGTIDYLSQINPLHERNELRPKDIYLVLKGYDRVFEMFIGEDKGDFSPRVNKINQLKIGDEIDIYFAETLETKINILNKFIYYLDKNEELIYSRGNVDKYVGYFCLSGCGILLLITIYMKVNSN